MVDMQTLEEDQLLVVVAAALVDILLYYCNLQVQHHRRLIQVA